MHGNIRFRSRRNVSFHIERPRNRKTLLHKKSGKRFENIRGLRIIEKVRRLSSAFVDNIKRLIAKKPS